MKTDRNIEEMTNKIFAEMPLESPSKHFVDKVMKQVHLAANAKSSVYQPLISKKGWFVILICVIGGVVYNLLNPTALGISIEWLNFSFIEKIQFPEILTGVQLPDFFGITFMFFALVVVFQMIALSRYFGKRNIYG